jgi:hypothetical protein
MCETWVATVPGIAAAWRRSPDWIRPSLLHERGDLDLGRREAGPATPRPPVLGVRPAPDAVGPEGGLQPGDVGGSAQGGVNLHRTGERGPRLPTVAGADELSGGCFQRLRAQ